MPAQQQYGAPPQQQGAYQGPTYGMPQQQAQPQMQQGTGGYAPPADMWRQG